ncbi:hypothetical protein M2451_001612 [Dysgonomonas sp. PFB1-18]|nr:hypothetical protein [Dysgonomonas sp. PF1-14]MDH6338681.1 hypothetical protein [Dysgonomonas sp. PF1-16]MDH6380291.1 hypothetical protein [Dysgonomonas sp. PFB1-18]MDH6397621.1 hypothetical protein [Dysgonomonas sp. PF1-23]
MNFTHSIKSSKMHKIRAYYRIATESLLYFAIINDKIMNVMKKKILVLFLSMLILGGVSSSINAQNIDTDFYTYYNSIESRSSTLSAEQMKELKELKWGIGQKFESINKNKGLSGYEKREKKRELKQQLNAEIDRIIAKNEKSVNDEYRGGLYGNRNHHSPNDGYAELARIDAKIEAIEAKLDANNDNDHISKNERKSRKAALKAKKKKLKSERDAIKRKYGIYL